VGSNTKVILVTHSMGGLVARAACHWNADFAQRVVGIVHTVQPVLGGALAYWRFLRGASDAGAGLAQILGAVWDKNTALMSVLPGPLQLLPNNNFRLPLDGTAYSFGSVTGLRQPSPWLQNINSAGAVEPISNIYEIYRRRERPGLFMTGGHSFSAAQWQSVMIDLRTSLDQG
jgi:pimeloyl-ACP methyl ester carboxylesterase